MDRPLTHAEVRLAVRELIQREDTRGKRRRFFRAVFTMGVASAVAGAVIACLVRRSPWQALFGLGWLCSMLLYTEFLIIPRTFMQDMDLRWHMNPWEEALSRLAEDGRQIRGVIILTIYPVLLLVASFVYEALK
jgi:hypothetical protein